MENVNGTLLKQKTQSENSSSPKKRIRESEDAQSTSKKFRRDDDSDEFSSSRGIINEPKAGVIEKIYMKNFMCHSSMEVPLNQRINFIVGRNGSGKSAVLAALVIGLGGKASATNRGCSLKEFVKKGTNAATIEITLRNTGHCSYKKDEYGDRIIVTRSISSASGQGCYKIQTGQGEVVSSKKEELDKIVLALNIQINNPITILNQDTARTFLNSSDPHEKYKLFMKATQLEQTQREYAESMLNKRKATTLLNSKKEALQVTKNEVTKLELKWKMVQSLISYQTKSRELENELCWAVAVSEEKVAEKLEQEVNSQRAQYSKLLHGVNKETELEQMLNLRSKKVDQQIREIERRLAEYEADYKGSREEVRRRKENYMQKVKESKSLELKILRIEANINKLREVIDEIKKNFGPDHAARQQTIRLEIQQLENKLADVQVTLKTNKHHYSQLNANVEKIKSEESSLKQELQENLRKIEQQQRAIQALKREKNNSATVFGAWVPHVSKKIDEAFTQRKFGKMPRGPVGAYIKLKDASWAPALESFLGQFLRSYCVDSAHDARVLTQIFSEVLGKEKKPAIITSKFFDKVHNVIKFAVQADGYSSILDSLIVSDTVVSNCLIDQMEVETILLIPTSREACEIMSDVRRVPMNCKRAITKKGDQFYPDPNYRMYAGDGCIRAKYLQVSMQDAISTAEEELKGYHFQKGEVEKQLAVVREQLRTNYTELSVADATVKKLKDEDISIQLKLTELKDMDEPGSNNIDDFTGELEDYMGKYADMHKVHDTLQAECQLLKDQMDEADTKSSQMRDISEVIQTEERSLLAEREAVQSDLREILSRKKFQEESCNELHKKILQLQTQLHMQQELAKKAVDDATKMCPKIDTERSPGVVERELNECKEYMERVEQHTGRFEEISVAYHERKAKYEQILGDMKHLEDGLSRLESAITLRKKTYHYLQIHAILRVQYMFQTLLHQGKYSGAVEIDLKKQTLEVSVSSSEKHKSADTMSGGERSYFTVSLIMALWDAIDSPFYFMDEFDVFMDKVNRRVITDLLLEHSRQKTNFQFVFLTPQDISTIQSDRDVTVYRMPDPCRGNNTQ